MANEVAALNTYHNGASYSVAELYDDEIAEYKKSFIENVSAAVHFDTDTVIIEECGQTIKYYANDKLVTDTEILASCVSDEHAQFDYALEFERTNANYAVITDSNNLGGTFTAEGWFYVDTSTATTDTGIIFALARHVQIQAGNNLTTTAVSSASYSYTENENIIKWSFLYTSGELSLPADTFDNPFHLAFVYQNSTAGYVFFNGVLCDTILSKKAYSNLSWTNFAIYNFNAKWTYYYFGTSISWSSKTGISLTGQKLNGAISEFKVTRKALYTADFTPPNKSSVWAKIPVEGNVAFKSASGTLYAPLSSNATYKTPPCLNVRHNGTNYFAIK